MYVKPIQTLSVLIAIALMAAPALATPQETRTLDADAEGLATDRTTGDTADASLEVDGDVTVTSSGEGVDRTAQTQGPTVTLTVTLDETTYTIPVTIAGEGVSLVQTGVNADAWRLNAQGSALDGSAQFSGSLILLGTDDGYSLSGDGTLTLVDNGATNFDLEYAGTATFE